MAKLCRRWFSRRLVHADQFEASAPFAAELSEIAHKSSACDRLMSQICARAHIDHGPCPGLWRNSNAFVEILGGTVETAPSSRRCGFAPIHGQCRRRCGTAVRSWRQRRCLTADAHEKRDGEVVGVERLSRQVASMRLVDDPRMHLHRLDRRPLQKVPDHPIDHDRHTPASEMRATPGSPRPTTKDQPARHQAVKDDSRPAATGFDVNDRLPDHRTACHAPDEPGRGVAIALPMAFLIGARIWYPSGSFGTMFCRHQSFPAKPTKPQLPER